MTYSVKEIYYTIQGEGVHTGRPAVFCRFSGCNLWSGNERDRYKAKCNFCDTDFVGVDGESGSKYQNAKDLVYKIISCWPNNEYPFVVLTGGEPMLQVDNRFIAELKKENCEIAIETNGTLKVAENIDWICVSPKSGNRLLQTSGNELKLVYPQKNIHPRDYEKFDFKHFSLQPLDDEDQKLNTELTIKYCSKNPKWRVSLQTHKIIGIR